MRAFQRRDNAFSLAEQLEAGHGLLIGAIGIFSAADFAQPGVLWPHAGVIQTGANAMRQRDLAVSILQHIAHGTLQHADAPHFRIAEARGVFTAFDAAPARFHANQANLFMLEEGVEKPNGIAAALGRNRAGTLPVLSELAGALGLSLTVVAPVNWLDKPVRSSIIRQHLREGDVAEAAELLGRAYSVAGRIVEGDKRGRQLGVPTANLAVDPVFLLPADGVYATHVRVLDGPAAGAYAGATNIGVRPTVDGLHHRVETHLLDYTPVTHAEELYGAGMRLDFVARLRGEKRFGSLDELVAQIHQDIEQARALFAAES